ncbi:MAG: single-stranded DNA-binding protein [Verrucomicrobia bacterium]|nr:single-stranded DNA-binding protein [Verrucomicrobiota bacterium]
MPHLNKVMLMGNLTRDPELKTLPSGMTVADLGLALSSKYKNKAGELVDSVCFVDVVAWDRLAQNCSTYLKKGSPVYVEGRLQLDEWEKDGQKRSKLRVRADTIQFLGKSDRAESRDGGAPADAAPASPDENGSPL